MQFSLDAKKKDSGGKSMNHAGAGHLSRVRVYRGNIQIIFDGENSGTWIASSGTSTFYTGHISLTEEELSKVLQVVQSAKTWKDRPANKKINSYRNKQVPVF